MLSLMVIEPMRISWLHTKLNIQLAIPAQAITYVNAHCFPQQHPKNTKQMMMSFKYDGMVPTK